MVVSALPLCGCVIGTHSAFLRLVSCSSRRRRLSCIASASRPVWCCADIHILQLQLVPLRLCDLQVAPYGKFSLGSRSSDIGEDPVQFGVESLQYQAAMSTRQRGTERVKQTSYTASTSFCSSAI